jgi:hypothetical protein
MEIWVMVREVEKVERKLNFCYSVARLSLSLHRASYAAIQKFPN